ncbi:unnamed protein product [Pleuronectes platessa]|uniref:Uncharacterized protein n=1 Tax=Pleuronectes platessa TaxID=8262 RepID=A0A9N7YTI2_PLEPL|nr:unnamed protein product [Pleuronectes platessa]
MLTGTGAAQRAKAKKANLTLFRQRVCSPRLNTLGGPMLKRLLQFVAVSMHDFSSESFQDVAVAEPTRSQQPQASLSSCQRAPERERELPCPPTSPACLLSLQGIEGGMGIHTHR